MMRLSLFCVSGTTSFDTDIRRDCLMDTSVRQSRTSDRDSLGHDEVVLAKQNEHASY